MLLQDVCKSKNTAYETNWLREIWNCVIISWQYERHFNTLYPMKGNSTHLKQFLKVFVLVMLSLNILIAISHDWIVGFHCVLCGLYVHAPRLQNTILQRRDYVSHLFNTLPYSLTGNLILWKFLLKSRLEVYELMLCLQMLKTQVNPFRILIKWRVLFYLFILFYKSLCFSYVCRHICVGVTCIIYESEHTQRPEELPWGHIIASSGPLQG